MKNEFCKADYRRVAAPAVVEHLDVLEQIGLCVGPRCIGRTVYPLVFQAVEEAFGGRIDAPMSSCKVFQISQD